MKAKWRNIPENVAIDFTKAGKKQKQLIAEILISNYTALVNKMVINAGYATTTGYWNKKSMPFTKDIIKPKDFIEKYGK